MALSDFYNDLADLGNIHWEAVKAKYWNDFPDGKRLRQAEFLVYESFEWHLIKRIGVHSINGNEGSISYGWNEIQTKYQHKTELVFLKEGNDDFI